MGTKRAYDEDLQELIKYPKHLDYDEGGCKYFHKGDDEKSEHDISVPDMVLKEFEINAPLPLVTGIEPGEDDAMPGQVFPANLFSDYFGYTFPRRQLFHYDDIYSSLLNSSPRKVIPIGPDHQADVPEFDRGLAKIYRDNGGMERFLRHGVITLGHQIADSDIFKTDCKCLDGGSIRCVQQHVKEARLNLRKCYGNEKLVGMGMLDMGEEVAGRWTQEEERLFNGVVYSNPASIGRLFWRQLSIAFPSRTKKELVSYYFNVFILRRRAVQNRSPFLDNDSDDDEWRGSYGRSFGNQVEDDDFVLGDHDEDDGIDCYYDDNDGGEGDVIGIKDQSLETNSYKEADVNSSAVVDETKDTIEEASKKMVS